MLLVYVFLSGKLADAEPPFPLVENSTFFLNLPQVCEPNVIDSQRTIIIFSELALIS